MAGEQTAANILVAIKRQTTAGTPPGATDAHVLRVTGGPGLTLDTAIARSAEKRADGNRQTGRHSSKSVSGSYETEFTVGGAIDVLLEAIVRSAWAAPASDGFGAVFTSIAISSNVLTASGGSFITEGYRVGQIVYFTSAEDAANNNRNLIITGVTASTLTVAPVNGVALTDNAADTAGTLNRRGTLVQGAGPTNYAHYVEQVDRDIDKSEGFDWCRLTGFSINIVPSSPITITLTFAGLDRDIYEGAASPYFTSPTLTTGLAVVGDEILLRFNGAVATKFTSLSLNFQIVGGTQPVIGSKYSPDVFMNDFFVEASATAIREDYALLAVYDAETSFEIALALEEKTGTAPFPVVGIFFPVVKVNAVQAPVGGGDGPKVQTVPLEIGIKASGVTGYDAGRVVISSSAVA
jgi:hypothetical protein